MSFDKKRDYAPQTTTTTNPRPRSLFAGPNRSQPSWRPRPVPSLKDAFVKAEREEVEKTEREREQREQQHEGYAKEEREREYRLREQREQEKHDQEERERDQRRRYFHGAQSTTPSPVDSHSESSGPRDGSPSPAPVAFSKFRAKKFPDITPNSKELARERIEKREKAAREIIMREKAGSTSSGTSGNSGDPHPERDHIWHAQENARKRERMKRILANTGPVYLNRGRPRLDRSVTGTAQNSDRQTININDINSVGAEAAQFTKASEKHTNYETIDPIVTKAADYTENAFDFTAQSQVITSPQLLIKQETKAYLPHVPPMENEPQAVTTEEPEDKTRDLLRELSRLLAKKEEGDEAKVAETKAPETPGLKEASGEATEKLSCERITQLLSRSSSRPNSSKSLEALKRRLSNSSTPSKSPSKSDIDPEERITAEAKLFELQDNRSERNSMRAPSRSPPLSDDGKFDETPKPKADPLSFPASTSTNNSEHGKIEEATNTKANPSYLPAPKISSSSNGSKPDETPKPKAIPLLRPTQTAMKTSSDNNLDETPKPKIDPLTLPTPKVTGAYIDTPAPPTTARKNRQGRSNLSSIPPYENNSDSDSAASTSDKRHAKSRSRLVNGLAENGKPRSSSRQDIAKSESEPTKSTQPVQPRSSSRPRLINTARPTTAAEDLRRLQMEGNYDDSTLDDFENMLESAASTRSNSKARASIPEHNDFGLPISEKELQRRLDMLILDRMGRHLESTSFSIRDARHGIERLEHQVSSYKTVEKKTPGNSSSTGWNVLWWLLLIFMMIVACISTLVFVEMRKEPEIHMGASDWWLGRDGPIGIVRESNSIYRDEVWR